MIIDKNWEQFGHANVTQKLITYRTEYCFEKPGYDL